MEESLTIWEKMYSNLCEYSIPAKEHLRSYNTYKDFVTIILKKLFDRNLYERVTYLTCIYEERYNDYQITGLCYPNDKKIIPQRSLQCNFTLLSNQLILSNNEQRIMYGNKETAQGSRQVAVYQIGLAGGKQQHLLILTYKENIKINKDELESESKSAMKFLNVFSHISQSIYLSRSEQVDAFRRKIVKKMFAIQGDLDNVAFKLGKVWCNLLKGQTVRFWIYNKYFEQLELLYIYCLNECEDNILMYKIENQLSMNSYSGLSLKENVIIKSWQREKLSKKYIDNNTKQLNFGLCREWAHSMCIPFYQIDQIYELENVNENENENAFFGVLDIHWIKQPTINHSEEKLLSLGQIATTVISRAHANERKNVIEKLNKIAINLASQQGSESLQEKRKIYLNELQKIILNCLHANCLSIFEANESNEFVRCVQTTGLKGNPPLESVMYNKGNGLTGSVFKENQSYITSNVRQDNLYKGLFEENRVLPHTKTRDPLIAVPIPGQYEHVPAGVIRVLERKCHVNPNLLQNFSEFDIEMLERITSQVSPIFQLMSLQTHRERFVERTTHQLIQPLQGVVAYSSNLIDGIYEKSNILDKLKYIRAMSISAASMTRNSMWASGIKDFSFLAETEKSTMLLNQWIIERIMDVQPIKSDESIKVEYLNTKNISNTERFCVNELYFHQVMQNLLHNAIKYSYPYTKVKVDVLKNGFSLVISIESTGVPINPDEEDAIFRDGIRGEIAEKFDNIGTGQGLYISRQIMKGLKGEISLLPDRIVCKNNVSPKGVPFAEKSIFLINLPNAFK
ncbi:MAG: hypothetical protein GY928_04775 [Colwellia sp.]|nr:hypothetical protein [Colwellia sp.]